MPNASGIRAGAAYVEMALNDSKLIHGLDRAAAKLAAFGAGVAAMGSRIAALGGIITTPFLAAAVSFAHTGRELLLTSSSLGMGVEALSGLRAAAGKMGADGEALTASLFHMQLALGGAAQGAGEAHQHLARLGLSLGDLQGLSPDKQFLRLADAIAAIKDPAERAEKAREVFGKGVREMLPLLAKGSAGIGEMVEEMRKNGLLISQEQAEAADKFGKAWGKVIGLGKTLLFIVGGALAPALSELAGKIEHVTSVIIPWLKENAALVTLAFKVAAGVVALGVGIKVLGIAIPVVSTAIGLLTGTVSLLGTAFAWAWSAALSPFIAGLGLLAIGIGLPLIMAAQLAGTFKGWGVLFGDLKITFLDTWGGIVTALKSGDLQGAFHIALLGLKVGWLQAVAFLTDKWSGFRDYWAESWADMVLLAQVGLNDLWAGMRQMWNDVLHFMMTQWIKMPWVKNAASAVDIERNRLAHQHLIQAEHDFDENQFVKKSQHDTEARKAARKGALHSPELAAAQKELAEAIAAATAAAKQSPPALGETAKKLPRLSMAVAGTFNALSTGGISFGPQVEIAQNTKRTADGVDKIVENTKGGFVPRWGG